jgi:hypothetical protein
MLTLSLFVCTKLIQQLVEEVVKHYRICPTFCDLRSHHTILSQRCYHGERISCVFFFTLLSLDPGELEWIVNVSRNLCLLNECVELPAHNLLICWSC